MDAVILIPAYQPDGRLTDLLVRLAGHDVVVVDDGSGPRYADVFARARALGAEVVTHDRNRGKGAALKTGFAHVRAYRAGRDVVCADSDGQHRPGDIEAVAARLAAGDADLVLGARRFTGPVPARSRFGNGCTRTVFRLATGRDLADTQTGLRGYPARHLPRLGTVPGARFEYEQRLLLRAVRDRWTIAEVPIATVYLAGNASSHFRPLRDSARVYGPLLAYGTSSLLAFAVDTALFLALAAVTGGVAGPAVLARLVSATLNFTVNRRYVFGRAAPLTRAARDYALLAAVILAANVVLLTVFTAATGSAPAAKLLAEGVLLAASFLVQRHVVFADRRPPAPVPAPGVTPARPMAGAGQPH
ncbi:bifunctional glycosyltransferase family 2/GtrA family protein [Catenuloplanes indicus]|uniref:Glycosyltransferase involved in cell wall biosynthesis n=1 Tax=Catenuloplanes indicus TaxID=137267 RepID=A0AAE3W9N8_9ACTN|nr:bifunctional glycosyltransferase family 2/GtrA family protein [Catenuloplanes indicus]MDQ0371234.1 glycosyltransferase involved in cell wall biosynthesis [Catenuloplanes indicus]